MGSETWPGEWIADTKVGTAVQPASGRKRLDLAGLCLPACQLAYSASGSPLRYRSGLCVWLHLLIPTRNAQKSPTKEYQPPPLPANHQTPPNLPDEKGQSSSLLVSRQQPTPYHLSKTQHLPPKGQPFHPHGRDLDSIIILQSLGLPGPFVPPISSLSLSSPRMYDTAPATKKNTSPALSPSPCRVRNS